MISAKEKLLERFRAQAPREESEAERRRLPPGQHLTSGFPVADLGVRPPIALSHCSRGVTGEVETPLRLSWEEFRSLPRIEQVRDFHCVTTWSKYDVRWRGVPFKLIAERAG